MKKAKKILTLVACAVLLVALSVGATIAFLTDNDAVTNTFTVGLVNIKLDEGDVYEKGEDGTTAENHGTFRDDGETRVQENNYQLIPGSTYDKDPTIHIQPDTATIDYQNCYVVAKITVNKAAELMELLPADNNEIGIEGIVTGGVLANPDAYDYGTVKNEKTGWYDENNKIFLTQEMDTENNNLIFTVYWENEQVPNEYVEGETGKNVDLVIFKNLVIPEDWSNDQIATLAGLRIDVKAYAVQVENFDDVYDAFNTVNDANAWKEAWEPEA